MKRWQFWLGVLISVVSLYLALRGLDMAEAWQDIRAARYVWLIPGVLVYFLAVWARTWRWHYMLGPLKPVPLGRLFPIVCIGYMGNNIYPARAGEIIRSYVLKRKEGISMSASLATVIVERVFDGLVMLLFVFISLPFAPMLQDFRQPVIFFSAIFFVALAVFMVLAASPTRTRRLYDFMANRFLPERLRPRVSELFDRFMLGLSSLRRGRDVFMIFATSIVIWLAETVKYWFVMHAFNFSVSFIVLMLMNGIVNLATTLPAAPGYVGTFDASGIAVLRAFNVPSEIAAAYTLVLHVALWFPITVLGAFFMWREQITWRDFGAAAQLRETSSAS